MSLDELNRLIGDKSKAEGIHKLMDMVSEFAQFKAIQELGLQINQADIPFEKVMMFSWIKEALDNGRANRV